MASSALAQTTDYPAVKVGDRWQFVVYYTTPPTEPNRAWVITSVTPTRIDATETGEPLTSALRGVSGINGVIDAETTVHRRAGRLPAAALSACRRMS